MRVRFWGTRGSIAKPGPLTTRFGGNTSCVEVRADDGTLLVLDCGTGAHGLGGALLQENPPIKRGHILIGHTHWDHIQGIPFFAPLFAPEQDWDIYAPQGVSKSVREALAGQMDYTYFPVGLSELAATIRYHDLLEETLEIGGIRVTSRYLNHPALTLGYRLAADGVVVVYSTDHEPHSRTLALAPDLNGRLLEARNLGEDGRHIEFLAGADLLIHDAQYTAAEYPGRAGWGHSTVEYVVDVGMAAKVKRLALFHHDPLRTDEDVDRLVATARARASANRGRLELFAAAEGQCFDLRGKPSRSRNQVAGVLARGGLTTGIEKPILVAIDDPSLSQRVAEVLAQDYRKLLIIEGRDAAVKVAEQSQPCLLVLDFVNPEDSILETCRAVHALPQQDQLPIVVLAGFETISSTLKKHGGPVSDWLVMPFSNQYLRTRIKAWLLRRPIRWFQPPFPEDERARSESARRLFEDCRGNTFSLHRIASLTERLFGTPFASINLIVGDKLIVLAGSSPGPKEMPRDISMCAYTILGEGPLFIPDLTLDDRFGDNPVVGDLKLRSYLGYPLADPKGLKIGTISVSDRLPRRFGEADLRALEDLAVLARETLWPNLVPVPPGLPC